MKKKEKSIDANSKMTEMLELSDKDFLGNHHKNASTNNFRGMLETNEK